MVETCGNGGAGAVMQAGVGACRLAQLSSLPEPAPSHPFVISLAQGLPHGENERLIQKMGYSSCGEDALSCWELLCAHRIPAVRDWVGVLWHCGCKHFFFFPHCLQ